MTEKDTENIQLTDLIGQFVIAKLKGKNDNIQGLVVKTEPFIIQGYSGVKYECEGVPIPAPIPPQNIKTLMQKN